jgi:hypothetical protein
MPAAGSTYVGPNTTQQEIGAAYLCMQCAAHNEAEQRAAKRPSPDVLDGQ